jgi:hypothetical protein
MQKTNKLTQLLKSVSPNLKKLAISRSPSPIRVTKSYLSILSQIYTSQSEEVGDDFLLLPHLEVFEYREEYTSTLESFMLSNLPSRRNNRKPAAAITTSIPLHSAYINMSSIIDKRIPNDIYLLLHQLQNDGILTYT